MNRWLRAAVLAAGAFIAGLATWAGLTSLGRPAAAVTALHLVGGVSFIAVGVLMWSQRPQNRIGLLMTAVGFAWFINDLLYVQSSVALTVADMEGGLYVAILAHIFLAFPSGRLRWRVDRIVCGVVYAWAAFSNLGPEAFWAPADLGCACPSNLLAVHRDAHLHTVVGNAHQVINALLALLVFCLVVRHWAAATRPGRRALAPVVWASGPVLVAVISLQAVGVVGSLDWLNSILPYMTPIAMMTLPAACLVGQVRSSLAGLAVGRLVIELGEAPPHDRLRDALADTFGDSSLNVAYWVEEAGGYVDADGHAVTLPTQGSARAVTLLQRGGDPVAALIHDPSLENDTGLMEAVAAAACMALENERLNATVKAQLAEVRASRARIVEAGDAARRRIERDLHDGAQQRLVSVSLGLRMAGDQLYTCPPQRVAETIKSTDEQLQLAVCQLRELAAGIHPQILTEAGLGPALQAMAEQAPIPVTLMYGSDGRLPEPVEAAAYFVVCEAITNVSRHAKADSATVTVERHNGVLRIEVADNGTGGADVSRGSGLRGLADRVAALDGRLEVRDNAGRGTSVVAEIPCA